jgi:hypothetical protein
MRPYVGHQVTAPEEGQVAQLRDRYAEMFGEMIHARNKQWMVK